MKDKDIKNAESTLDSANQNNPSLRANPQDLRGNPPCEKTQNSQIRLPRSRSLARNDDYFPLDSAESQNLGENSTRVAESSEKSPQDEFAKTPKLRSIIVGASGLSLGISIVVAILLGVGAGILMQRIFNVTWVLFLGVFWGIAAAVLNVYKVYKAELRDFDKLANEPKYKY